MPHSFYHSFTPLPFLVTFHQRPISPDPTQSPACCLVNSMFLFYFLSRCPSYILGRKLHENKVDAGSVFTGSCSQSDPHHHPPHASIFSRLTYQVCPLQLQGSWSQTSCPQKHDDFCIIILPGPLPTLQYND